LLFVPPADIELITGEGGWAFVVVDDHKTHVYNQTEIRSCEEQREIQFRALSYVDYPKEAARYCQNDAPNCIFLTNGQETFQYTDEVSAKDIGAFIDANLPHEL
jgi:hypothetical protein